MSEGIDNRETVEDALARRWRAGGVQGLHGRSRCVSWER